jgi:hypothetical protein
MKQQKWVVAGILQTTKPENVCPSLSPYGSEETDGNVCPTTLALVAKGSRG